MTYEQATSHIHYQPGTVTGRNVAILPLTDGLLFVTHTLQGRALQIALYASPRVRARHAVAIVMEARKQAAERGFEVTA